MVRLIVSSALLCCGIAAAADTRFDAGKQAYARRDYAEAVAQLTAAAETAAESPAYCEIVRFLAAAYRETGDRDRAEQVLALAVEEHRDAGLLEDLATMRRAQGRPQEALTALEEAVEIREARPDATRIELARDRTIAAMLHSKLGNADKAIEAFQRAIREWDLASPGDPQSLTALESLAVMYRDRAAYQEAEPLLERAVRLREAANGPDSAEVISAVDSLAYVEFGLKKFAPAEALYRRLAALWEKNAGADHPMLALTFDKMAEFYAFQQRYADAEIYARRALELRTRTHLASLNQTGRVLLMEAKLDEADKLYRTALQIGDLAEAPDDAMDPLLRTSATLLRTLKRDGEAEKLDARVKAALLRKADREGRLPSPVTPPK